jgi:DNA-binding MarR family transcriptional regulator/GNAT superfamily N-acetyltransferase
MSSAIDSIREFNRFFTHYVGALEPRFLGTEMTLGEARLLFEIAHLGAPLAMDLQVKLDMDPAYVSRVINRFEHRGWINRGRTERDARRRPIELTSAGQEAFHDLDDRQRDKVSACLEQLSHAGQRELVSALTLARVYLGPKQERKFQLRPFRPGDMGLIASRQSILYRETYGWGPGIEVNIGEVTAAFLKNFKPGREQCWVVDLEGVMAGSIFVTDEGDGLCRLRLLYVEHFARGLGIGDALVSECVKFARSKGYEAMTLWTHTILETARRIYAKHGFKITEVEMHEQFGSPIQAETWRLNLH